MQANLASRLMETIPGCSSTFLHQFVTQHDMTLQQGEDHDSLCVSGDLHKVLCLHDNLSQLVSVSGSGQKSATTDQSGQQPGLSGTRGIMKDKAVLCDILQPQFSRSGRQIKRRNLEHPMEKEDNVSVESFEVNVPIRPPPATGKKKRGRPAKNPKPIKTQESPSEITNVPKADTKRMDCEEALSGLITLKSETVSLEETLIQGEIKPKSETQNPVQDLGLSISDNEKEEELFVGDQEEKVLDSVTKESVMEDDGSHSDPEGPDISGLSEKENTKETEASGSNKKGRSFIF